MGELINLNSVREIADADIPAEIARDTEIEARIAEFVANPIFTGLAVLNGNVAVRIDCLKGTTASTQGGAVSIFHNFGDKIIWFGCKIAPSVNAGISSDKPFTGGYDFECFHHTVGPAQRFVVRNSDTNSANILSKPFSIVVISS